MVSSSIAKFKKACVFFCVLSLGFLYLNFQSLHLSLILTPVSAQTIDELQSKINQRNQDIQNLEKEIKDFQNQINALGNKASSLANTIQSLKLNQKKLEADIEITQNKIAAKDLEIQKLSGQISDTSGAISDDQRIVRQAFVTLDQDSGTTMPELILSNKTISEVLDSLENIATIQKNLYGRLQKLSSDRTALETNKRASVEAQADLIALQNQLGDQRKIVLANAAEQKKLLAQTNQSETAFKKILVDKKAQQEAFQQELNDYESELHLLVNPALLPHTGSGVLSWPLDNVFITQYFGNTPFATANSQIYNGKGHTGIDLRATIGTPVKAAAPGKVVGVANTDAYPGCYSYGKWIMVQHTDGLSTLYAHLSVQSVVVGEPVMRGDILGYSGNTGYTTGPHLHFGVYATQGVQIRSFDTSLHCKGALIPTADFKAYLNPLSYL